MNLLAGTMCEWIKEERDVHTMHFQKPKGVPGGNDLEKANIVAGGRQEKTKSKDW